MTRFIKRGGKIWVRVFPDKPITKKPQETRMGKGKGAPEEWVCVVRPGRILFEMEGVTADRGARSAAARGVEAAHPDEVRDPVRRGEGVMMDVAELRDLSVDDLEARAKELEDQLFRMRLQQSLGQLDAPLKLRFTRRDLARIKTVITEKQTTADGCSVPEARSLKPKP